MLLRRSLALAVWLGIALMGCDSSMTQGPPNMQPDLPVPPPGYLNVVHAVPDSAAFDVYVDGSVVVLGLDYRKGSGNVQVSAGSHKVELRPAGAAATDAALWTGYVLVQASEKVLLLAAGRLSDGSAPTGLSVLAEPFGTVDPMQVRMRVLHASPSAAPLDVSVSGNTLFGNIGFEQGSPWEAASTQGSLTGPIDVSLTATGSPSQLADVSLPGNYQAGEMLTLIVFGETNPLIDDTKFFAVSVLDEVSGQLSDLMLTINRTGPQGFLYVFHAAPDTPAFDVFNSNGALLIGGLGYQQASTLMGLWPGLYSVNVQVSGHSTLLVSANVKLLPATSWAVFAAGLLNNPMPGRNLTLYAAPLGQQSSSTSWRVLHAVPDAANFDLAGNGSPLFPGLSYAVAPAYRSDDLPVTTLQLSLSANPKAIWGLAVSQTFANSTVGAVTTIYLTGTSQNPAEPLSAVAVVESSATPKQAPMVSSLATTIISTALQQ
jgi:hypothetical protein